MKPPLKFFSLECLLLNDVSAVLQPLVPPIVDTFAFLHLLLIFN